MPTSVRTSSRALLVAASALAVALPLSGCSPGEGGGAERIDVLASFYPLEFVAERVGGPAADVRSLTPAGAEPHDLELSPAQVRAAGEADVVVVLSGFQPAVDEALTARAPEVLVDVADLGAPHEDEDGTGEGGTGEEGTGEDGTGEDGTGEEAHADEHDSEDPHFWLDPTRLAEVADRVAEALSRVRPDEAEGFAARAAELRGELVALDEEIKAGLASCESRLIVTSHEAFGYLADRYDLEQIGISGLDPESEPSPARLREIAATVEDRDVSTIFSETLVSPRVAEVLAADLGVETAVLDPVEGLVDPEEDYLSVMRANLAALREALRCA